MRTIRISGVMMKVALFALAAFALVTTPAKAAPGLAQTVYGATVEPGETEFETRYGRLVGGADSGEEALVVEAAHGFSKHFYAAVLGEFEREAGGKRRLEALSVEAIHTLGQIKPLGIDVALYGEYEAVIHGSDKIEAKLLLEKRQGPFDARLNLIASRPFSHGAAVDFGYAASADVAAVGEFRLGAAAFGDLGSSRQLTTRGEHFAGPIVKTAIEHLGRGELEIETGYLFALGRARDDADGQVRLLLAYATHF